MADHIEHLNLGPYDPIDDDLNQARDILAERPDSPSLQARFVIGYVRQSLDNAAENPEFADRMIRYARAMLAAFREVTG